MTTPATPDCIEERFGATIQHGPFSRRIYLMKIGRADTATLPGNLERLALEQGYTKIFAKVPKGKEEAFIAAGYRIEATIPGFYEGRGEALFLGRYFDQQRAEPENRQEIERIVQLARSVKPVELPPLPATFTLRPCREEEVDAMAAIYRTVFPTYPFPIHDPAWLLETMRTHIDYFGIEHEGRLVALASSEMELEARTVEMTDFATLPEFRGHGLALHLLVAMEAAMRRKGIATAYTIARAVSAGMNITFAKAGYRYSGTLTNNTNISGGIESMNIWYKPL